MDEKTIQAFQKLFAETPTFVPIVLIITALICLLLAAGLRLEGKVPQLDKAGRILTGIAAPILFIIGLIMLTLSQSQATGTSAPTSVAKAVPATTASPTIQSVAPTAIQPAIPIATATSVLPPAVIPTVPPPPTDTPTRVLPTARPICQPSPVQPCTPEQAQMLFGGPSAGDWKSCPDEPPRTTRSCWAFNVAPRYFRVSVPENCLRPDGSIDGWSHKGTFPGQPDSIQNGKSIWNDLEGATIRCSSS